MWAQHQYIICIYIGVAVFPELAMKVEVGALKSVLALYLELTGGPSVELCNILLKLVDYLDTDADHSAEIGQLASTLLVHMAEAMLERCQQLGCDAPQLQSTVGWARCRVTLVDVTDVIVSDIRMTAKLIERYKLLPDAHGCEHTHA